MSTTDIILAHPVRTAIGAYNGTLKGVAATELGAVAVKETLKRAGLSGTTSAPSSWATSSRPATG